MTFGPQDSPPLPHEVGFESNRNGGETPRVSRLVRNQVGRDSHVAADLMPTHITVS